MKTPQPAFKGTGSEETGAGRIAAPRSEAARSIAETARTLFGYALKETYAADADLPAARSLPASGADKAERRDPPRTPPAKNPFPFALPGAAWTSGEGGDRLTGRATIGGRRYELSAERLDTAAPRRITNRPKLMRSSSGRLYAVRFKPLE